MKIPADKVHSCVQQAANAIARKHSCSVATHIDFCLAAKSEPKIIKASNFYYTTKSGEYISNPNAYKKKGFSNMVYNPAECIVAVPETWKIFIS